MFPGASRIFNLNAFAILPAQDVVLTVSENKKQLTDLVIKDLLVHKAEIQSRLTAMGHDSTLVEINLNPVIQREDLKSHTRRLTLQ